jgi:threonine aldolase
VKPTIFGSDNQTGASAPVMEMICKANAGHAFSYGDDEWTARAVETLKEVFQCDLDAFFVSSGTAANSLALSCLAQPWESVLCHSQAHILLDESTAPEFFTGGARLIGISQGEGKLEMKHLDRYFRTAGAHAPHNPLARVLSLTQASENGLVYTPEEIGTLTEEARRRGITVHMDGARFSNAVAALGCAPADIAWKAGVDVLCLGATKNGALAAEAVLFFKRGLAAPFMHRRKRSGHLLSKGRFFGAQFQGWLQGGHWLELAGRANARAARLAGGLSVLPGVRLAWPTQANEVFVVMPRTLADGLRAAGAEFYDWYPEALPVGHSLRDGEIFARLVTSFVTEVETVDAFLSLARDLVPGPQA